MLGCSDTLYLCCYLLAIIFSNRDYPHFKSTGVLCMLRFCKTKSILSSWPRVKKYNHAAFVFMLGIKYCYLFLTISENTYSFYYVILENAVVVWTQGIHSFCVKDGRIKIVPIHSN